VAVVVTKADLLDGFRGEEQVVLVGDDIRYSRYRGYGSFVSAVLQQPHVSQHLPWREQVEQVLDLLKPLVDYCLTKSPDLQVFFISSTGGVEHTRTAEGEEFTRPPRDLRAVGLDKPFVWSVRLLMEKRRALKARRVKWWVAGATALFIVVFSLFNWWHESRIQRIRKLAGLGGVGGGTATEKVRALQDYRNHLFAGFFRSEFRETVDLILGYQGARAQSSVMEEAIAALNHEEFSEARRAMRDLRDQFPEASQEYRSYDETLALREAEWDRAYAENRLEPLIASARTSAGEIEHALNLLFRPDNREDWQARWQQRRVQTMEELRRQDVDRILRATGGLGGRSWSAVERIKELCKAYLDSYVDDVATLGAWRTTYTAVREIEGLLDRALQAQESPNELRGIASQLRSVQAIQGQGIGARLATHLGSLGSEVTASSAGEELDKLIQDLQGGSLDYRFSESFKNQARRFVRNFEGTPEGQRVQSLLRRIETAESNGFLVAVAATEVPAGYHLRIWNAETQAWDPAEIEPGLSGRLRWRPGDPVRIGLEKTDPHNVGDAILDEWAVTGRWSLFLVHEQGGHHVFRGNYPVTITFPDLEQVLPGL